MRAVLALMLKDVRLLLRDRMGLFFTCIFPLLYGIFFGTIMSGLGDEDGGGAAMRILVVDEDRSAASEQFVQSLESAPELAIERIDSRDAAFARIVRGGPVAFVRLPGGFGEAGERLFWGEPRTLEVGVDPSRSAEAAMLKGFLMKVAFEGMAGRMGDPAVLGRSMDLARASLGEAEDLDAAERARFESFFDSVDEMASRIPRSEPGSGEAEAGPASWQPIEVTTTKVTGRREGPEIGSAYAISFPQAIVWGVMGAAAAFGISLVSEATRGTLMRLRTAPLTRSQVLLGKAGACFLTTVTLAVVLLVIVALAFGVRPGWGEVPKLAAAVLSIAVCFVGIMMLLSVIGKTEAAAGGIGWAVLLVMAMFGGGMIPLFFLRGWMQTFSHFSPVKWSILALEGVLWRGFTWEQMALPCLILLGIGAGGFAAGAAIFRRAG